MLFIDKECPECWQWQGRSTVACEERDGEVSGAGEGGQWLEPGTDRNTDTRTTTRIQTSTQTRRTVIQLVHGDIREDLTTERERGEYK